MPHLGKTRRRRCKSRSRRGASHSSMSKSHRPLPRAAYLDMATNPYILTPPPTIRAPTRQKRSLFYEQTVHLPRLPRKM